MKEILKLFKTDIIFILFYRLFVLNRPIIILSLFGIIGGLINIQYGILLSMILYFLFHLKILNIQIKTLSFNIESYLKMNKFNKWIVENTVLYKKIIILILLVIIELIIIINTPSKNESDLIPISVIFSATILTGSLLFYIFTVLDDGWEGILNIEERNRLIKTK